MLVAGYGATKEATSALPQLTVQHCAGCLVTEGLIQEKGCKTIPSCPQSRITYTWHTPGGGSPVCSESCRKLPNSTKGKEIALGKKLVLQLGAAWPDTPQPFWKRNFSRHKGRQSHFHCLAKSEDSKQTGSSRHKHEQLHWVLITIHIFGPPARLGAVSGGVNHSMSSQWKVLPV